MRRTVVVDTNVLIHLGQVGRLEMLAGLSNMDFVVPEAVIAELLKPESRDLVEQALRQGWVQRVRLTGPDEWERFESILKSGAIGSGEAECLALAELRNWRLASDDYGRSFRRQAAALVEAGHVTDTLGLVTLAIRAGLLTVAEADEFLSTWSAQEFRVEIRSFAVLVSPPAPGFGI
jgi:predicted nucleic acid-binding protein